jgi:hypothetical protein
MKVPPTPRDLLASTTSFAISHLRFCLLLCQIAVAGSSISPYEPTMITVGWHCYAGGTVMNSLTPIRSSSGEPSIRRAGGIVEELLASMQSLPSPNLGLLLIGFLQSFGREIDFSHVRLVLKGRNGSSGGLFWPDKASRPLALCIDDPLRPGANIGAGSFNMFHVQVRPAVVPIFFTPLWHAV